MLRKIDNFINKVEEYILTDFIKELFHKKSEDFVNNRGADSNWTHHKADLSHQAIWYGSRDYSYSNGNYELKARGMPDIIKSIAEKVSIELGHDKNHFNSCYINRFDSSGIGKHHDNDTIFRDGNKSWHEGYNIVVATVSLGVPTTIKVYDRYDEVVDELLVDSRSLYIMPEGSQVHYKHEVKPCNGLRFSLTFRRIIV